VDGWIKKGTMEKTFPLSLRRRKRNLVPGPEILQIPGLRGSDNLLIIYIY
jgi:hypothetical protein